MGPLGSRITSDVCHEKIDLFKKLTIFSSSNLCKIGSIRYQNNQTVKNFPVWCAWQCFHHDSSSITMFWTPKRSIFSWHVSSMLQIIFPYNSETILFTKSVLIPEICFKNIPSSTEGKYFATSGRLTFSFWPLYIVILVTLQYIFGRFSTINLPSIIYQSTYISSVCRSRNT